MATVAPVVTIVSTQGGDVPVVTWTGMVTGDTITAFALAGQSGLACATQVGGTFGGATIAMTSSNDNSTFFAMYDMDGVAISCTAAAMFKFTAPALYVKPSITSGSANSVDVIMVLRG